MVRCFWDEIGEYAFERLQVKLLRVLQQKKVTRVGGTEHCLGCKSDCGDKSQSGTDGQRGNVPGGSILPTECGFNFHSAAAGAPGGYHSAD